MIKMRGFIVAFGAALAMAGTAQAGPTLTFIDTDAWGPGSAGGPFEVRATGITAGGTGLHGAAAGNFLTFCVERNENIRNGRTYDAKINTAAIKGGVSGSLGGADPLGFETAYLYTAFIKGTLSSDLFAFDGSVFTYQTEPSGGSLQDAIWYSEGEISLTALNSNSLARSLYDLAVSKVASDWGQTIGNVRILNLTRNGEDRQDQLVIIPLPGAAAMGLAGLGMVAIRRRR